MTERGNLLESIASTIKDYRAGEIEAPTAEHVGRWVTQFGGNVQIPLLREVDHVFKETYLSRQWVSDWLADLVRTEQLAGTDPCAFWDDANFLRIQQNGNSQDEILELFGEVLEQQCSIGIDQSGNAASANYIYLDDVMFSGNRVGNDLAAWIETEAPAVATIHVVVVAIHTSGEWLVGKRLKQAVADSGKKIEIHYWRARTIENRKYYKDTSEVLWPTGIPDDVQVRAYVDQAHKFPFEPRSPGGKLGPFSSEEGRQLLEREMLIAGARIRGFCRNPRGIMRPLGFSPFGVGFGSMLVTFRNCPNNCPLALWWGDPEAPASSPLSRWYPLFPRKTYEQGVY
jgi:hypothetical protein